MQCYRRFWVFLEIKEIIEKNIRNLQVLTTKLANELNM